MEEKGKRNEKKGRKPFPDQHVNTRKLNNSPTNSLRRSYVRYSLSMSSDWSPSQGNNRVCSHDGPIGRRTRRITHPEQLLVLPLTDQHVEEKKAHVQSRLVHFKLTHPEQVLVLLPTDQHVEEKSAHVQAHGDQHQRQRRGPLGEVPLSLRPFPHHARAAEEPPGEKRA
eukprot:916182-Prorocentrum_minimum.AAC.1